MAIRFRHDTLVPFTALRSHRVINYVDRHLIPTSLLIAHHSSYTIPRAFTIHLNLRSMNYGLSVQVWVEVSCSRTKPASPNPAPTHYITTYPNSLFLSFSLPISSLPDSSTPQQPTSSTSQTTSPPSPPQHPQPKVHNTQPP